MDERVTGRLPFELGTANCPSIGADCAEDVRVRSVSGDTEYAEGGGEYAVPRKWGVDEEGGGGELGGEGVCVRPVRPTRP